jgi:hypothetical protein
MSISPEYIQPLREEVEWVVREQGWTKTSILKMRKLDSFLREAQRMNSLFTGEDRYDGLSGVLTPPQLRWSGKP